jgi:hypothetical protein
MDPSDEILNEHARRWAERVAETADTLEALALEWKVSKTALEDLPMGIQASTEIDPTNAFTLPHAKVVMDCANKLRSVVASAARDFK